MPSLCSTNSTSGKAALPWETMFAGPPAGSSAPACDDRRPDERVFGALGRVFHEHLFQACFLERRCSRAGRIFGTVRNTFRIPSAPIPVDSTVIFAVMPLALLPWAATVALNLGANGRVAQLVTWNGIELRTVDPSARPGPSLPVSDAPIDIGSQLLRVELEFRPVDVHVQRFHLRRHALEDRR